MVRNFYIRDPSASTAQLDCRRQRQKVQEVKDYVSKIPAIRSTVHTDIDLRNRQTIDSGTDEAYSHLYIPRVANDWWLES